MNPKQFAESLAKVGIKLSEQQKQQFNTYYQYLIEVNQQMNLTRITGEADVYLKHFYDSITPALYCRGVENKPLTICDVGAGAGFPSLPLKIIFPKLKITIIDSLNKRIKFLENLVEKLGLTDVKLIHTRAEEYGSKNSSARGQYDIVTARAVARLSVLSELCLPLVKIDGKMLALKAAHAESELGNSQTAIRRLGGSIDSDHAFTLPESHDDRHIIVIKKVKKTPKGYPRKAGTPNKKPIGDSKE